MSALQPIQEGHRQRGDGLRPPNHHMLANQALPQRMEDDAGRQQLGDRFGHNCYPQPNGDQHQHRLGARGLMLDSGSETRLSAQAAKEPVVRRRDLPFDDHPRFFRQRFQSPM